MNELHLYPSLTFLFAGVNLAAWYFQGRPLFNWWWVVLVIVIEGVVLGVNQYLSIKAMNQLKR